MYKLVRDFLKEGKLHVKPINRYHFYVRSQKEITDFWVKIQEFDSTIKSIPKLFNKYPELLLEDTKLTRYLYQMED